ncbi:MAG: response regulator transcription factor [Cyclobacteriaceae bacterium]|nr:response regulator transcription factor [Cyclobacteriaceae bacterium]
MKLKIAIAEDNLRFRTAFQRYLKEQQDLEFVIVAENGADLLLQLESVIADVVLLDIRMPVMDGFEAARLIRKKFPDIKIAVLTQFDIEENIIEMNRIGINSFIGKDQVEEIPRILDIIGQGGVYYPDRVAEIIKKYLNRISVLNAKCPVPLSELERILLQSISQGKSPSQIGELINKSPRTVEKYRNDLYQKFNVANQQQLIFEASKWSLLK